MPSKQCIAWQPASIANNQVILNDRIVPCWTSVHCNLNSLCSTQNLCSRTWPQRIFHVESDEHVLLWIEEPNRSESFHGMNWRFLCRPVASLHQCPWHAQTSEAILWSTHLSHIRTSSGRDSSSSILIVDKSSYMCFTQNQPGSLSSCFQLQYGIVFIIASMRKVRLHGSKVTKSVGRSHEVLSTLPLHSAFSFSIKVRRTKAQMLRRSKIFAMAGPKMVDFSNRYESRHAE